MSVDKILQKLTDNCDGLVKATEEEAINKLIQSNSESYKELLTIVDDLKFMVKANDDDQTTILEILKDCVTQLKDLGTLFFFSFLTDF